MARGLRIVPGDARDAEPVTIDQALQETAARIAALNPLAVLVVFEKPDGTTEMRALPNSQALAKGLVLTAYDKLFPESENPE
jgi:hypothetical protein